MFSFNIFIMVSIKKPALAQLHNGTILAHYSKSFFTSAKLMEAERG